MRGKLGLADALATGTFVFSVQPMSVAVDLVYYANLGCDERILMVNLLVRVLQGAETLPPMTTEYAPLFWTEVARFVDAVDRRDPIALVPDGDPFELCVHGLCVASAAATLRRLGLIRWDTFT
jgi:hypothetical protein